MSGPKVQEDQVQEDQAERKKMDKPQTTESQKTYSVLMIGASSFMEDGNEWWMNGFPSLELATEFARRWVRSCVEEARRDLDAPLAWRQVGENALVPGHYDAGEDAAFFAAHPATAEEVDWQAVKRAAGLEETPDEDQNAEGKKQMNQQTNSVLSRLEPSSTQRLSSRFEEAFVFAAQKHQTQTRKGTTIPYVAHLMQVSGIALENGANEDEAIAALLHDVIEDQDETPEELTRRFGPEVAAIVAGCSDSASTDKAPWKQRKEAYIAHVLTASTSVRLVSSSDKLHNARAILADYQELGDALWSRFNASPGDILWYYESLVHAFQQAQERQGEPPSRVVAQLDRVVTELAGLVPSPDAPREANLA